MDEYVEVKINVFEHTGQRARVRKALTIEALIEEILREFDDVSADSPEKYAIYLKGEDQPVDTTQSLSQLDIQPHDELTFEYLKRTIRQMLSPKDYACLVEASTGKRFDIQWQPAVIGRSSGDMDHNLSLAVNLKGLPVGMTVSRKHAQITVSGGKHILERLAENNPVFVNGQELPLNGRQALRVGDKIAIGRNKIVLTFSLAPASTPTPLPGSKHPSTPIQETTPPPISSPDVHIEPASLPEVGATLLSTELAPIRLVIEACSVPGHLGEVLDVLQYPFEIGRSLPVLNNEGSVSRRHAAIHFNPDSFQFTITDLHSTNGVTVDGRPVPQGVPYPIYPGCRIGLGNFLIFRMET